MDRLNREKSYLTDFSPSYDNQLLAIQLDNNNCDYDEVYANAQCEDTSTLIYDTAF